MEQDRESLKLEIVETQKSLQAKIDELGDRAHQTVDAVTTGVKHAAQTLRKGAQLKPVLVVTAALGIGAIAGARFARRRATRAVIAPGMARVAAAGLVTQAAGLVAPIVVSFGAAVIGDWAKRKYPKSAPYVDLAQTALGAPRPPEAPHA